MSFELFVSELSKIVGPVNQVNARLAYDTVPDLQMLLDYLAGR